VREISLSVTTPSPTLPVVWIAGGGGIAAAVAVGAALAMRRRRANRATDPPAGQGKS